MTIKLRELASVVYVSVWDKPSTFRDGCLLFFFVCVVRGVVGLFGLLVGVVSWLLAWLQKSPDEVIFL